MKILKKINLFVFVLLLLTAFSGCDKKKPEEPVVILLVSTTEVENADGTIVEALYSDSTRMYFRLLDETTAEVVSYYDFYDYEHESAGWIYRGKVTIPEKFSHSGKDYTVVGIGDHAFGYFFDGHSLYYASFVTEVELPNTITRIGDQAFYSCDELVSINLPNSLTYMGYAAFDRTGLTSVEVPNSMTEIMHSCFAGCEHLSTVKLPNTIVWIGDWAFGECPSLTTFEIPESVESIGMDVFLHSALKSLTCRPMTPPAKSPYGIIYEGPLFLSDSLETIYVPMQSVEAYKNDYVWSRYADIITGF